MQKRILFIILFALMTGAFIWSQLTSPNKSAPRASRDEVTEGLTVYETEVDGPGDCSSFEIYDEQTKTCTFKCADDASCKKIQEDIDTELATWADAHEDDKKGVIERTIPADDQSIKAEYRVSKGEKITLLHGSDELPFRHVWKEIADLSPDSLSDQFIDTYQLFDRPDDDTLAFVDDENNDGKWRIAVNLSGHRSSTVREQKSTLIHELAHIISLSTSQIDIQKAANECVTFYLDEGCTHESSYLNMFQKKFWKPFKKATDGSLEYHETHFVSEYASTNEVEDLAESFASFVLEKGKQPSGLLKHEKVNFFYDFNELAQLRTDMRSVLAQSIIRAKKR